MPLWKIRFGLIYEEQKLQELGFSDLKQSKLPDIVAYSPSKDWVYMIDSKTTYFANLPNCYLIIENVPCKKCTQCGEEVFSMSVIECIDQIIASVKKLAGKVCVLEYQSAA